MNVQLKRQVVGITLLFLIIIGIMIVLTINIDKIIGALQTPPLTEEQLTALTEQVVDSQERLIKQRQIEVDSVTFKNIDSLTEQVELLQSYVRKLDSTLIYMRTFELTRMNVSVLPPKKEVSSSYFLKIDKKNPTWADTLSALQKITNMYDLEQVIGNLPKNQKR